MSDDRSRTELGPLIAAHPWSRAEFVSHYNRIANELGEATSLSLRQLDRGYAATWRLASRNRRHAESCDTYSHSRLNACSAQ